MAPPNSAAPSSRPRTRRCRCSTVGSTTGREQVWMSHGDHVSEIAPGFRVYGTSPNAPFAITADPVRQFYAVQFHPEVHHTPRGRAALRELRATRGLHRRLDDGRLPRGRHRQDPRTGGRREGDLRTVRRGRQLGRRRSDPRGDRRPADLRLRRSRPAAAGRGGTGRDHVPRHLQHPADPCRRNRPVPERAGRRHRPRGEAQDHRAPVHRRVRETCQIRRRREVPRARHALPGCDRKRQLLGRAVGHDQDRTTMSAACPRRWA